MPNELKPDFTGWEYWAAFRFQSKHYGAYIMDLRRICRESGRVRGHGDMEYGGYQFSFLVHEQAEC
jgi:hypothetical protein